MICDIEGLSSIHTFLNIYFYRYELVPKQVKEDEFWRNYFYRVNLIKQSFDLKDLETSTSSRPSSVTSKDADKEINNEEDVNNIPR